ncbi:DHS-like NAD/FAD-binding domain-containing protein [Gilbertella persicaria]|uniref:DHS-like NAD/FAD-binding domain-containing protein n=1 Tax=Gilbertella persicaria TaxID=101096 RepID=UPI002220AB1D|nr:DHS-like NAD/FAD-binding domain-containing protein [Gilbertella persicaria]KAI8084063.1 DHS-like NAD/FAD-binding domain-containing protein [Gilbertella persicaria]
MKKTIAISEPSEVIGPFLTELSSYIAKSKRALVVTGAGISCSSGIPDFRSSDGLYNLVKKRHPDIVLRGKELFDATLFRSEKTIKCFYTFMAELRSLITNAEPTITHEFIQSLTEKGQLLRCYTQNIDFLEENLNIPAIQLHGTMKEVRCTLCSATFDFTDEYEQQFRKGEAPGCPQCESADAERTRLGKRQLSMGTLRPAIVLYNEDHPQGESIGQLQVNDLKKKPDLMIVMGTSLKIPALKKFIKQAARIIHSKPGGCVVFVNRTSPTKEWEKIFDYEVLGDSDRWVELTNEKMADEKLMTQTANKIKKRLTQKKEEDEEEEKENKPTKSKKKTITIKSSNSKRPPLKRTLSKSQTTLREFTTKRRNTARTKAV